MTRRHFLKGALAGLVGLVLPLTGCATPGPLTAMGQPEVAAVVPDWLRELAPPGWKQGPAPPSVAAGMRVGSPAPPEEDPGPTFEDWPEETFTDFTEETWRDYPDIMRPE